MSKANKKSIEGMSSSSTLVFQGVRFDVHSVELPGKNGRTVKREYVAHPGAVVILPILDEKHIVLIQNERFAVGKTLWELPAGTLEPKESPIETAARELIEETGYESKNIQHLTTFYTTPGICNEIMHAYSATDLTSVGQKLDENERITTQVVSWKTSLDMIKNGTICDGKTISTLLFYQTFLSKRE